MIVPTAPKATDTGRATALREQVTQLLAEAKALDEWATETRAQAGGLLLDAGFAEARVRAQAPAMLGIDERLADLLVALHIRQKVDALAASLPSRFPAGPGDRVPRG